jgi:hypothetical protein
MKKESILFASYLLGSVFAQDLSKSFGDGTLPEFLMRYDVNEDGIIDEEERQAVKEERKAARKKNRSESGPNRNSQTSPSAPKNSRKSLGKTAYFPFKNSQIFPHLRMLLASVSILFLNVSTQMVTVM